ncbi:MAG: hypothetical protein LBH67_02515 [Rickettsia sp.]|nr:hypothetical protein [Rickettsia sp.]
MDRHRTTTSNHPAVKRRGVIISHTFIIIAVIVLKGYCLSNWEFVGI